MISSQSRTLHLQRPEGRIAYDVTGEGPLVVCMPGMGDRRASYRFVVPLLVAAGYRVATMDLRGLGESSTGWSSYSQTAAGDDGLALISHLGGPAVLVGHSFTPDSALFAAVARPDDVTGVVLLAPWARRPELNPLTRLLAKVVTRSPLLYGYFYKSLNRGRKPADLAAYLADLRANLREPGRTAAFVAQTDPTAVDAQSYRTQVERPALVVMGSKDPDFTDPAGEAEQMRAALACSADVVMVADAGHYPHAQTPDETATAVVDFLRRITHA